MAEPFNNSLANAIKEYKNMPVTSSATKDEADKPKRVVVFVGGYDNAMIRVNEVLCGKYGYSRVDFLKGEAFKDRNTTLKIASDATLVVAVPRTVRAPIVSEAKNIADERKIPFFTSDGHWASLHQTMMSKGYLTAPVVEHVPPQLGTRGIDLRGIKPSASQPAPESPARISLPPASAIAVAATRPAAPVVPAVSANSTNLKTDVPATHVAVAPASAAAPTNPVITGTPATTTDDSFSMEELRALTVSRLPDDVVVERARWIITEVVSNPKMETDELYLKFNAKFNTRLGRDGLVAYVGRIGYNILGSQRSLSAIRHMHAARMSLPAIPAPVVIPLVGVGVPAPIPTSPVLEVPIVTAHAAPAVPVNTPSTSPLDGIKTALSMLKDEMAKVTGLSGSILVQIDSRTTPPTITVQNNLTRVVVQQLVDLL